MFQTIRTVEPKTASEQTAYDKWFDQRADRQRARADRTHGAEGVIPTPLWIVLFLSAAIIFGFMLLFADSGERAFVQATMIGGVAVVISSTMLLLWFLDNPYHGGLGGLRPTSMERTLGLLDVEARIVGRCDSALRRGRPRAWLTTAHRGGIARGRSSPSCCSALAAIATAWATYQAAHWRSEQALAGNRSTAARVQANRAASVANRQIQVDVATFIQWVDAYATGNTKLADFYFRRFRDEFRPAVTAWIATKPLTNPKAPLTPFVLPQYSSAAQDEADALEAKGARSRSISQANVKRADRYALAVVLFATSLFFAGISARLANDGSREVVLGMGWALFLGAVIWMATFPIDV